MPPQPPAPQPDSIILSKFDGLKNTVSRERLGASDLESAINVDLDDAGQLRRRRGVTQVASGAYHSLFTANDGTVYGVLTGVLGIIRPDYSFVSLGRTVGGDPTIGAASIAYSQVGPTIYYTCASDAGKIDTISQTVSDWGPKQDFWLSPVVNPTATLPAIRGRLLGGPPRATTLTSWHGRLYMGHGPLVWATELYLYDLVDKTRNFFQFEGNITMLGTVSDGYYVGTTEGLYFCAGDFPQKRTQVMGSPVIPGSMVYIPGELGNPPQIGLNQDTPLHVSLGFMTTTGFCVAQEGGEAYNLTEGKFDFPNAIRSAALYRRQDGINQYIAVNDSAGDPVNNARIGDYVEADIVRFRGAWVDETDGFVIVDSFTADIA